MIDKIDKQNNAAHEEIKDNPNENNIDIDEIKNYSLLIPKDLRKLVIKCLEVTMFTTKTVI